MYERPNKSKIITFEHGSEKRRRKLGSVRKRQKRSPSKRESYTAAGIALADSVPRCQIDSMFLRLMNEKIVIKYVLTSTGIFPVVFLLTLGVLSLCQSQQKVPM